ncbi:MAG: FtsX-like permease family protein, partial [Rhodanobacter sp.]
MLANWFGNATYAFIRLKPGVAIETLTPRLKTLIDENVDPSQFFPGSNMRGSDVLAVDFQSIETIHLDSPWDTLSAGGNKTVVFAFAAISALVLFIACINFTILTTAKATQRAREVAMRKTLGARRRQLIVQFLGESFFIVLLAMVLSLAIVQLMLPVFEAMVGKSLAMSYGSPLTYVSLLALLVIVSLCGGLYPAFILSSFRPGTTLKANRSAETRGSTLLRHVLVTFQFSVSIVLIIATAVIYAQIEYSSNRDPGYNKDNLLVITQLGPRPDLMDRLETLKQELLGLANVSGVTFSSTQPSQLQGGLGIYTLVGGSGANLTIGSGTISYDYFSTYQIPLVAGRDFDISREGPETQRLPEGKIIINESAVRVLGLASPEEAIGRILTPPGGNRNLTIIGVVADSHLLSINAIPEATIFQLFSLQTNVISVRYLGSREAILEQVGSVWRNVMGGAELYTAFVDQLVLAEFAQAQVEAEILISFSLLAIFIACLGLFGAVSFTVDRRTKEIGLRKVMGAKVKNIVSLLLWQFSKPVLVANLFAWPIAIWLMLDWLEGFPYRIDT